MATEILAELANCSVFEVDKVRIGGKVFYQFCNKYTADFPTNLDESEFRQLISELTAMIEDEPTDIEEEDEN